MFFPLSVSGDRKEEEELGGGDRERHQPDEENFKGRDQARSRRSREEERGGDREEEEELGGGVKARSRRGRGEKGGGDSIGAGTVEGERGGTSGENRRHD